jgi:hypothetical protein
MSGLGRLGLGLRNFGRRGSSIGGGSPAVTTALAMGMNTNFSGYGYNQQTFTDLIVGQGLRYFDNGTSAWMDVPDASLDASGWPTAMLTASGYFAIVMMVPDAAISYKVTWDDPSSKASFVALTGATGTQTGNSITFTAPAQPSNIGVMLKWGITAGGGYPSNFQCRPAVDDGSVLSPNFKAAAQALCQNGGPWRVLHMTAVEDNPMPDPAGPWTTKFPVDGDGQLKWPIFTSTTRNTGPLYRWDGLSIENFIAIWTGLNRAAYWNAPWNCDSTYLSTAATKLAAFAASTGNKVIVARSGEVWNKAVYHVATQCQNEADYHATLGTKTACRVAATSNITLSGTQTIDGVAVVAGDRVLCVGQTTASQNGVYVVAAGAWSRAADTIATGDEWQVTAGTSFPNTATFRVRTTGTITVGTTALSITRFQNYERYAEKAKELFDACVSAFTSAGVLSKLECALEWQNGNGNMGVWDAMIAIAPNYTGISTAPYVGENTGGAMSTAGYGTGYVGPISAIWPSAKTDCDSVLSLFKGHNDYVLGKSKKMFIYEGGPQIGFTDVTTFTNFVHDIGNYDYVQYFLQEVEKINPNVLGSMFQMVQSTQLSNGAAFSPQTTYWGFLEGTYQTPGANTPKYNAFVDFFTLGKRSPQTLLSSGFLIAPSDPNGKTIGTVTRHVRGSTVTIQAATGFDPTLLSAGATTGTSVAITIADKTKLPASGTYSFTLRETHSGFPAGYNDTVFSLIVAANSVTLNPTTGVNKSAGITLTNGNLTEQPANGSGNFVRATAGPAGTKFQLELTVGASGSAGIMVGVDDGTQDYSTAGVYPGSNNSSGWLIESTGTQIRLYYGASGTPKVVSTTSLVASDVLSIVIDSVARTMTLYRNNVVVSNFNGITITTALSGGYNAFAGGWGTVPATLNFGASAFTHTLDPGYVAYSG